MIRLLKKLRNIPEAAQIVVAIDMLFDGHWNMLNWVPTGINAWAFRKHQLPVQRVKPSRLYAAKIARERYERRSSL
jgi:hypothetical protein